MKRTEIYDLDGTLSSLNNTFDFMYSYFKYSKRERRYIAAKLIHLIFEKIPFPRYELRRRLMITVLFYNLEKSKLEYFFENTYKIHFLKNLTKLGTEVYKKGVAKDILLTGCIEVPAKQIGNLLGFQTIISTTFNESEGKIKGIMKDTYGNQKKKFILKKQDDHFTYYTDEPDQEQKLLEIMDKVVIVRSEK